MDTNFTQHLPQHALSDRVLIEQGYAGDDSAFETLVHRYQNQLYRFVCTWLDSDEADDVVQFVWVQLYRCLSTLQSNPSGEWNEISLKPWLLRVAWNRCIDERRRRKRHQQLYFSTLEDANEIDSLSTLLDPAPLPEEWAEQQEEQGCLCAAIQTLPPRARAIVWLRYTGDLPFRDIAHRLHIPTTTAKATFYRACAKLRVVLSPQLENAMAS